MQVEPVASSPPQRLPPRPSKSVLTAVREFARDPLEYPRRCARQYGDVVRLPLPIRPLYIVSDPTLIERVLVKDHKHYIKDRFTRTLADVTGNGLLVSEGDFWKRQRRLAQPAFHHKRILSYAEIMVEVADRVAGEFRAPERRDVHADMLRITLGVVSRTLFGTDASDSAERIGKAIEEIMERYLGIGGTGFALPKNWPTPGNRRFKRAVRELDEMLLGFIRDRRSSGSDPGDLLSMLLRAQDDDGARMNDRQLRDECVTLFGAGHETTALALTYALHLLSTNQHVELRLVSELRDVLGERPASVEDVPKLRYTECVIKEALRLYPPAWAIGREAAVDCELGGYRVPKGTQVGLFQYVVHRDPRFFSDPDTFRPERWEAASHLPRFAYFPFGGGPRICIGNTFAMMESVLVLATLMRRFRFEAAPGGKLELKPSITLRPRHGLPMWVTPR